MERGKKFLLDWGFLLVTMVIVTGYIIYGLIEIERTDATVLSIIADSSVILFLGITLMQTLGGQGETSGEKTEEVEATKKAHAEEYDKTAAIWHKADKYCEYKNYLAIKSVRTNILRSAGLKYQDYYNADGTFNGFIEPLPTTRDRVANSIIKRKNKDIKKKNKALKKSLSINITMLTPADLSASNARPDDPNHRGRKPDEFRRSRLAKNVVSKLLTAVLGGFFVARFIGIDKGIIIYRMIIGIIMLGGAFTEYVRRYMYVTGERRQIQIAAIRDLEEMRHLDKLGVLDMEVDYFGIKRTINSATTDRSTKEPVEPSVRGTTTSSTTERTELETSTSATTSTEQNFESTEPGTTI